MPEYQVDVTGPDGAKTSMTNTDVTKITATLENLKVDYARGYFGQKIISDTLETTIDFLTKVKSGLVDFFTINISLFYQFTF